MSAIAVIIAKCDRTSAPDTLYSGFPRSAIQTICRGFGIVHYCVVYAIENRIKNAIALAEAP